jgi:hypothetical protein
VASHWFRISYAENALKRLLASRGLSLSDLSVADGVEAMIEFYESYRPQHTEQDADGDVFELRREGSSVEVRRTMTRSDGTQPARTLVLSLEGEAGAARSTRISSPDDLYLVRAHLREEPLVKAQLPVHLRME